MPCCSAAIVRPANRTGVHRPRTTSEKPDLRGRVSRLLGRLEENASGVESAAGVLAADGGPLCLASAAHRHSRLWSPTAIYKPEEFAFDK